MYGVLMGVHQREKKCGLFGSCFPVNFFFKIRYLCISFVGNIYFFTCPRDFICFCAEICRRSAGIIFLIRVDRQDDSLR